MSVDEDKNIGQQFGNYRLVRRLGSGGFASVYLGQHVSIAAQQAAVKILHLFDVNIQHFQQEAETTAALVHPHIVRLFDFALHQGTPFLVMDYAPYGSLRKRHPKGTVVPLATVVQYVKEIAPALQYAHERHIIHRDVKPENVLISLHNELLLSDFGIALLSKTGHTSLQYTNNVGGTAEYMAPEMFSGKPEKASDQYSLGIMVYEWLCGTLPYSEGNFIQLGYQHNYAPIPSMREKQPVLAPSVEAVVMKALAKDHLQRFASVNGFALALEQAWQEEEERLRRQSGELPSVIKHEPISINTSPKKLRSPLLKWPALVLALVLVCILVIGSIVLLPLVYKGNPNPNVPSTAITHSTPPPTQVTKTVTPTPDTLLTAEAGPLAYHDVLTSSSTQKGNWQNDSSCFFASNGYHVATAGKFALCHQRGKAPYQDVTITIDMLLNGGTGALLFRDQDLFSNVGAYVFELAPNGRYKISVLTPNHGTIINKPLLDWTFSTALHQGIKVVNTLQIITIGNNFLFYMNGVYLTSRTDKSYIDGGISLACYDSGEAIFTSIIDRPDTFTKRCLITEIEYKPTFRSLGKHFFEY